MTSDRRFPELVSIACHDLRTPLATVYGFSRTLSRLELAEPAPRYVEMIDAASEQLGELLDQLSLVTRIESGRWEPALAEVDSLVLAREAATELGEDRVTISGAGASVLVEPDATRRALIHLARAAARHGGHDSVSLAVNGSNLELSPLSRSAAPVLLGEELRELGAAAAGVLVRALGGSLEAAEDRLLIRLPASDS
jgi:signal transduction histidine kinase